ncbi:hypothetical protein SPRG_07266 [Saprolegnia parasitica CBS 223.65]|uniref:Uncharacterized protein n=1 Tax=Saprolegnia parasitica (strain CBS 223.65) TaxID=695850 RepID=A0A067CBV1_SAPPC|nr:hypothetical protein SPRG_07266 [Saprolegnia parasitica CBS 223.65]KDO27988.1 hypothetical protein SPRG_07266 [Saprolegnia parasitica CBS 223.65]|eukprot:XP_012201437.1 hypothetical protein SPRG_07266 [Saprolegnia parasitica CBS 223.65]
MAQQQGVGQWTRDEHRRYLRAIQLYPQGPWKSVADYIGTRTARQTQTHAQKHREKLSRRRRGLLRKRATSDEWLDEYGSSPSPQLDPAVTRRSPNVPNTAEPEFRVAMIPPIAVAHTHVELPPPAVYRPHYDGALASDDALTLPPYPRAMAEDRYQPYAYTPYTPQQQQHDAYPAVYTSSSYHDPRSASSYAPMAFPPAPHLQHMAHHPPVPIDEMLLEYFGDDIRRYGAAPSLHRHA